MRVYKVSPIVEFSPFFSLTYVSKLEFGVGDIVPINFNNREIEAVVLESVSLKDAKVEIRKADFQTKKIEKRLGKEKEKSLDKKLLKILIAFSEEFVIPIGQIIHFLDIPLARRGESKESVTFYPDDLSLKIEKKENAFRGREMFSQILRNKIETLIIKDFNFFKYLNFQNPHISKLHLLMLFVKEFGKIKKIILEAGNLGVAESVWLSENIKKENKKEKLFGKFEVEIKENTNTAKKFVIKTGKDKNGEDEILSSKAIELFSPLESPGGGKIFVFVLSHGYADRIFCKDCQASYNCENCEHPFSILNEEERFLYCKNCKNKKLLLPDQYLICKKCGSWRIFPFGIGVQRTKEFLEKENIENIVAIDESQKKLSVKKLEKQINAFLLPREGREVLVGSVRTLKVLQSLGVMLDKTFVISLGPLTRGTTFDSDEKLMNLISSLENISKELYLNKREGDEISLENYKDKKKFIEEEIKFRKSQNLPPFTKVASLIFNYKNKRQVDKFISYNQDFKNFQEIKKGRTYIYYWFFPSQGNGSKLQVLRQFGDLIISDTIVENSILGKV